MSKIKRLEQEIVRLNSEIEDKKKKKRFKFPSFKIKRMFKQGEKIDELVVVQYLTQKYGIKFKLCRLVSGNLVVMNNKVHEINPKTIWRFGKYRWYILREIDRKPVSNMDYNKVKRRRDDTEADIPLIKAVLGAIQKQSPLQSKGAIIVIGIIVVICLILYFLFGGS